MCRKQHKEVASLYSLLLYLFFVINANLLLSIFLSSVTVVLFLSLLLTTLARNVKQSVTWSVHPFVSTLIF